jgi:hypothetical protein
MGGFARDLDGYSSQIGRLMDVHIASRSLVAIQVLLPFICYGYEINELEESQAKSGTGCEEDYILVTSFKTRLHIQVFVPS